MNERQPITKQTVPKYHFMQIPRFILGGVIPGIGPDTLSKTAILLYGLLWDRTQLSAARNFCDKDGAVYVRYPRKGLGKAIGVTERTIYAAMNELKEAGLAREKRAGLGKSNYIYLTLVEEADTAARKAGGPAEASPCPAPEGDFAPAAAESFADGNPGENPEENFSDRTDENFTVAATEIITGPTEIYASREKPRTPRNPSPAAPVQPRSQTELSQTNVWRETDPLYIQESSLVQSSQTEPEKTKGQDGQAGRDISARQDIAPPKTQTADPTPSASQAAPPKPPQQPQANAPKQPPQQQASAPKAKDPYPAADAVTRYKEYRALIMANIDYKALCADRTIDLECVDELIGCMLDVAMTKEEFIWIGKAKKPTQLVLAEFLRLNEYHIRHVLDRFKAQYQPIIRVSAYLKAMMFTVRQECAHYYTNAVRVEGLV